MNANVVRPSLCLRLGHAPRLPFEHQVPCSRAPGMVVAECVPFSLSYRLCSLRLRRLTVLKELDKELSSVLIAVKIQVGSSPSCLVAASPSLCLCELLVCMSLALCQLLASALISTLAEVLGLRQVGMMPQGEQQAVWCWFISGMTRPLHWNRVRLSFLLASAKALLSSCFWSLASSIPPFPTF